MEDGGMLGKLQAGWFLYKYTPQTDAVLAKAKQLGIVSCP
jgi:hypothetical protein